MRQILPLPKKNSFIKDVVLNQETHEVEVLGNGISLTAREFAILELLMENPKKVFTKANLYESVWQDEFFWR